MSEVQLDYYLPSVGRLGARLVGEGADAYTVLAEKGEIDSYKRRPQLGIVAEAWEGARHTRWEYITLVLALIDACHEHPAIATGAKVNLGGGRQARSAVSLMQTWALLLPLGHAHWSFTAERLLLENLRPNDRRVLAEAVPVGYLRDFVRDVVRRRDVYRFYVALSLYRLRRKVGGSQATRWQELLGSFYVAPTRTPQSLDRVRFLYRRIRRFAFLCLDAEYSPTVLGLRLSRLMTDPDAAARLFGDSGGLTDEMASLEDFLSRHIYLGPDVLREAASRRQDTVHRIQVGLEKQGLAHVVEQLQDRGWTEAVHSDSLGIVFRLEIDARYVSGFPGSSGTNRFLDPVAMKGRISRWAASQDVEATYEVDASRRHLIVQFHTRPGDLPGSAAGVASGLMLLSLMRRTLLTGDVRAQAVGQRFVVGDSAFELVTAGLGLVFDEQLRWRVEGDMGGLKALALDRGDYIEMVEQLLAQGATSSSRKHELRAAAGVAVRLHSRDIVMAVAPLIAVDPRTGEDVAEFDGVLVSRRPEAGELVVTVLEAKEVQKGSVAQAHNALLDACQRLGWKEGVHAAQIRDKQATQRRSFSWRHFSIAY